MEQATASYLPWPLAKDFFTDAFCALGVPRADAEVCTEIMLESDRRGIVSHGCNRFRPIYVKRILEHAQQPVTRFEVIREGPTSAVADGHNGMGMVVAEKAMRLAMQKAEKSGMAMVAVRNSTHFGITGYYTSMAAREGLIGIAGCNTRPSVAPTGGVENLLGTNPISVSFPTDEAFPFCFDCATSMIPRGKVEYDARNGIDLPKGAVIDADGREVRNAQEAKDAFDRNAAALTPLGGRSTQTGGHKGYGLSAVVEVFSAALQDGPYLRMLNGLNEDGTFAANNFGHFFIAVDPDAFLGRRTFAAIAGNIMRELRSSRREQEDAPILTAGEKEYRVWQALKNLGVPLNPGLREDLIALRDQYQLPYRFPFETDGGKNTGE